MFELIPAANPLSALPASHHPHFSPLGSPRPLHLLATERLILSITGTSGILTTLELGLNTWDAFFSVSKYIYILLFKKTYFIEVKFWFYWSIVVLISVAQQSDSDIYMYLNTYIYIYIHIYMYIYIHSDTHIYVFRYIYVYIYVWMYIYIYIYTHTYIYAH